MRIFFIGLWMFGYTIVINAQLPVSNIYLFEFKLENDSLLIEKADFLTDFNAGGYNNQPYFLDGNHLLISSNYLQEEQTDIFQLDLRKKEILQITDTEQSEYSPTPTPEGGHFSVIRVEPTQDDAQYLWRYPLDRKDGGFYYFKDLVNVGYHCWLDSDQAAMFLVNDPYHQLAIGNIKTRSVDIKLDNIGRTLIRDAQDRLLFAHKISDKFWYIKSYDPKNPGYEIICRTLDQKEDFALMEDGSLLMASGSKLYRYRPQHSESWQEICNFGHFGLQNITRLRVYKNKLCLVNINTP